MYTVYFTEKRRKISNTLSNKTKQTQYVKLKTKYISLKDDIAFKDILCD